MPHLLVLVLTLLLQPPADTVLVPAVITSERQPVPFGKVASPLSTLSAAALEREGVQRIQGLSAQVPNLFLPDYGAPLTASLYHRGFGTRIDNPVLALYVDGVPVLDKNAYDFDYLEMAEVRMLRGAQGTLYGRNAMSGVLLLRTLSPAQFQGWRGELRFGSGAAAAARLTTAWDRQVLTAGFRHNQGFYVNTHTGRFCDPHNGLSLRHKWEMTLPGGGQFENTLSLSGLDEGGFAYSRLLDGERLPIAFDGENAYRRLLLTEGATYQGLTDRWHLRAAASLQLMADRMRMDQDFTPEPVFTLEQRQRVAGTTFEAIVQPVVHPDWWNASTGLTVLYKFNRMNAPVQFLENGTERLILDNANRNIPASVGYLDFTEHAFPIYSDFSIQTWNAALFHESTFTLGRWLLTLGLRLDYEGGTMAYDSRATVHYQFHPYMRAPKAFETRYKGRENRHNLEILPKVSVLYEAVGNRQGFLRLFVNLSKGYKAGGFNTQIFSDILQGQMMNGLMDDLGVHLDQEIRSPGSGNTCYRPEDSYTLEAGFRFLAWQGLSGALNGFAIDCRNQQLTVFPPGQSTGRMMTNAGRSVSRGVEGELAWQHGGLDLRGAFGLTRAHFRTYHDGNADYAGKVLPYAPASTLSLSAAYRFAFSGRTFHWLEGGLHVQRTGRIWWDDGNTRSQDPYALLGAHLTLSVDRFELFLRGENLTDTRYDTFYFKSVGNEFFQLAKPRRLTAGIAFKIQ